MSTIPDVRELPLEGLLKREPSDLVLCVSMVLVAACYMTYILAYVYLGKDIQDGILLSGVVATIAFIAGRILPRRTP